jgi:hypothetical protein
MSAMFTIVPSSSRNATDSGTSVLRIQKQWAPRSGNTNSIPSLGPSLSRIISPRIRLAASAATSALIRWMPAWICTCGSRGLGWTAEGGRCWVAAGIGKAATARQSSIAAAPRGPADR